MLHQFSLALRALRRQPSFLATAVAALALGIAAPTALFAVVQATLLRPLPYSRAADIYTVRTTMTDGRFTIGFVASEEMASLSRATDLVTQSALVYRIDATLGSVDGGVEARQLSAVMVSEGFFDLFGMPMAQGRAFGPEDHAATSVRSGVLSAHAWRAFFGSAPSIVGQRVIVSGGPVFIVGIAPDGFDVPHDVDLWVAGHFQESIGHAYDAYVRLRPGASVDSVRNSLGPMWQALAAKYPDQAKNRMFVFRPLLTSIVGDLGPTALIAFAATGLLLCLAIANVANLLLARGAARARDLSVRVALGARRRHLIQQSVAESMVIAIGAAAIGVPLAYVAVRGIVVIGGNALPRVDGLRFDPIVAGFAAAVMILAGVVVGLLPALTTNDAELLRAANESGRGGGMQSRRTRVLLGALVVSEVALAVALVAGAGRLVMSTRNLLAVDLGFRVDGRLLVDVLLPAARYGPNVRSAAWVDEAEQRLRDLGATHVGTASTLPLRREWDSTSFTDIVGRPVDPQYRPNGRVRVVSRDFFDALGIRVVSGRVFTVDDRADSSPVVVVNQAWVTKFLPGIDPLREQVAGLFTKRTDNRFESVPAPIVGVVADVRYSGLDRSADPMVYLVNTQRGVLRLSLVLTTADGRPERLVPQVRAALRALDPSVPVEFDMLSNAVTRSLVWSRLGVVLMGTFGLVSLLLAGSGVFGVLAFVGAERRGEVAVRLCLGATRANVFALLLTYGVRLVLIGGALGTGAAWWMGRLMSSYVYEVSAANAVVLGGSAAVVIVVALAATVGPARRAALVDSAAALRGS